MGETVLSLSFACIGFWRMRNRIFGPNPEALANDDSRQKVFVRFDLFARTSDYSALTSGTRKLPPHQPTHPSKPAPHFIRSQCSRMTTRGYMTFISRLEYASMSPSCARVGA